MSRETYVIDTCTLIYFYYDLKASQLLRSLFPKGLRIVPAVKNELLKLARKKGFDREILGDLQGGFLTVEEVDVYNQKIQSFLSKFEKTLDTGERFSAALALSKEYIFLTDDWTAQLVIMFGLAGLSCKGTKWILDQARKKRLITQGERKRLEKKLQKARRR